MEFVENGMDLEKYVGKVGMYTGDLYAGSLAESRARVLSVAFQASLGLAYCHKRKIVHQDVKFENFLVVVRPGMGPLVKVADFGLSRRGHVRVQRRDDLGGVRRREGGETAGFGAAFRGETAAL